MITHNNLFSGSLGKLQNIGGSRIYTTPNTVKVEPEYSITLPEEIKGELIANSRDGKLWFYLDAQVLYAVALKWNKDTARLEFAASKITDNYDETVLACGLDWILTNKNIFMVADSSPYIYKSELFDKNIPDTFLYSFLRSNAINNLFMAKGSTLWRILVYFPNENKNANVNDIISSSYENYYCNSAYDPFTDDLWGKRYDNGNSEGNGYFSKDTHLLYPAGTHTFDLCYSLLPNVGDWQIFENFLIRRPNADSLNSYNSMLSLRPLIPLEPRYDYGLYPEYGTGYNFDHKGVQLIYSNGQLWGKGFINIGKVSLFPAVWGENGNVLEYYLYISPDFHCSPYKITEPEVFHSEIFYFGGHAFSFFDFVGTWNEAEAICESFGGHLATAISPEKNFFLASIVDYFTLSNGAIYLGGKYNYVTQQWEWVTGEKITFFTLPNGRTNDIKLENGDAIYMWPYWKYGGKWEAVNSSGKYSLPFICEWDYVKDADRSWLDVSLFSTDGSSLYGFSSTLASAVSDKNCLQATEAKIFLPQSNQWLDFSKINGKLFVDLATSSALLINDRKLQLLYNDFIETSQTFDCQTLPQWITPAGNIDAIFPSCIISHTDNFLLCSYPDNGFKRDILPVNEAVLPAQTFNDNNEGIFNLAISHNDKSLDIYPITSNANRTHQPIAWENIYKEVVKIELVDWIRKTTEETALNMLNSYSSSSIWEKYSYRQGKDRNGRSPFADGCPIGLFFNGTFTGYTFTFCFSDPLVFARFYFSLDKKISLVHHTNILNPFGDKSSINENNVYTRSLFLFLLRTGRDDKTLEYKYDILTLQAEFHPEYFNLERSKLS